MTDSPQPFAVREWASARRAAISDGAAWLLTGSFVIALAAFLAWGGLFAYRRSLDGTREEWRKQVGQEEQALAGERTDELISFAHTLAAVRELLAGHVFGTNVFRFLEEATHPRVQFTNFSFNQESRRIDVSGLAASYRTVAEQVSALEAHREVERVEFGGLAEGERGFISFKLAITVKPTLSRFAPERR